MSSSEFRENSINLTKALTKEERQTCGIYFTPKSARDILFDHLPTSGVETVLEPSFGSGEFILDARRKWPDSRIYGVEKTPELFRSIPGPNLFEADFLEWSNPTKFDVVIGNPPYFVTNLKDPRCMNGRGNVFVLFVYKCLTEHLKEGGHLAFVLPTSFYNSKYYEPCRRYIAENTTVTLVQNITGKFMDTAQDTMALVIRNKRPGPEKPYFVFGTALSPFWNEINHVVKGSTTLAAMGWRVKTGDVVWNENKDKMGDDGTLLIYTTNIVNNSLVLGNIKGPEKKQYVQGIEGVPSRGPAFLISRGYGNKYRFSWAFVPEGEFWAENHLNVISPRTPEALALTDKIRDSLGSPKTKLFISYFFGNGAISKTELETIFPIF